jgi:hypothetical protein
MSVARIAPVSGTACAVNGASSGLRDGNDEDEIEEQLEGSGDAMRSPRPRDRFIATWRPVRSFREPLSRLWERRDRGARSRRLDLLDRAVDTAVVHSWNTRNVPRRFALLAGLVMIGS